MQLIYAGVVMLMQRHNCVGTYVVVAGIEYAWHIACRAPPCAASTASF